MDVFYFGSPLARFSLSSEMLDSVNEIADQVLRKVSIENQKNHSSKLFSAVNTEIKFPYILLEDFTAQIIDLVKKYHENFRTTFEEHEIDLKITHMWMISQKETEWGFLHSHTGSISGILYLEIPKDMGETLPLDDKRRNMAGCVSFAEGVPGLYRNAVRHVVPKKGDLWLFPADLMHTIYPIFGSEERRSLSFNIQVSKRV